MEEIDLLKNKLLGNCYSRISIGDTFDLCFDEFWLTSHNFSSADEDTINSRIAGFGPLSEAIDTGDIAKVTILATTLRKSITEVKLNPDASLELNFENGVRLRFTTDTEVVDWQWALTKNLQDPYIGFVICVFEQGKIKFNS